MAAQDREGHQGSGTDEPTEADDSLRRGDRASAKEGQDDGPDDFRDARQGPDRSRRESDR